MNGRPVPHSLPPSEMRRLGEFFVDRGYTEKGLAEVFGDSFPPGTPLAKIALLLDTDGRPGILTTLVRLFRLGRLVSREEVCDVLPEWAVSACRRTSLLTEHGGFFQSFFHVDPVGEFLLASDSMAVGPVEQDVVPGNNPYATRLLNLTPRLALQDALDAFCGGGFQALHLAQHCENVTATELNPRAIAFAELNAGLNGVDKVRWLQGDRLSPVAGRQFDLIVANPPFFIGPALARLYSDNEMELDAFCCDVVRQSAKHLKPGGHLLCLAEWVELDGQDWRDRLRGWFEGIGCDAWVVATYRALPERYAKWRVLGVIDPEEAASKRALEYRIAYFRQARVTGILGGGIFLHQRQGKNWVELDDYPVDITGPCGEEVLKGFARRDFLSRNSSDEQLLQSKLAVSASVRLEQTHRLEKGSLEPELQRLHLDTGMEYRGKVNDALVNLLRRCDGSRTLREVLESLGATQSPTDDNQARLLNSTRRLIRRGALDPQPAQP